MSPAGKAVWYRIVEAKAAADADSLLSSDEGRFHSDAVSEPTSYAADSLQTAWLEHSQDDSQPDISKFVALAVECPGTFCDLRLPLERERHAITADELRTDPPSERCREAARKLRQSGAPGLIYASNRDPQGTCIAIFLENTKGVLQWHEARDDWHRFVRSQSPILKVS